MSEQAKYAILIVLALGVIIGTTVVFFSFLRRLRRIRRDIEGD